MNRRRIHGGGDGDGPRPSKPDANAVRPNAGDFLASHGAPVRHSCACGQQGTSMSLPSFDGLAESMRDG